MSNKNKLYISTFSLILFTVWTILLNFVDKKPIGPNSSQVGFATLNELFHSLTGVNMALYTITDWLGLVPIFVGFGFAVFGLYQWIQRKSILKVDFSLLALGIFYIIVLICYILFEYIVINRRPVLIDGFLEASYPSSTTLLVTTVMPTALIQFNKRIKNKFFRCIVAFLIIVFLVLMVIGRLVSGVHWLTDIIGGLLLSIGLISLYRFIIDYKF